MQRRNFVKGLLFTVPALYIRPLACMGDLLKTVSMEPPQDLVIYFMGQYGRHVFESFRHLRRQYPILNRCDHVSMDVNSEDGFILVTDHHDPLDLLMKSTSANVACFVMGVRQPDAMALADSICKVLRKSSSPIIMCLTPFKSNLPAEGTFNLTVNTCARGYDLSAHLLLVLYNTYLGCGMMGNNQCLKVLFDIADFDNNVYQATVGMAHEKGKLDKIDAFKFVADAFCYLKNPFSNHAIGRIFGIVEMSRLEMHVIPFYSKVLNTISQISGRDESDCHLICHLGIVKPEVRLTILNLQIQQA